MSVKEKLIDLIREGDFKACFDQMCSRGLVPSFPLEKGERIWVSSAKDRWICGIVDEVTPLGLWLNKASWIDNTGEYWSVALKDKGAEATEWSSEYLDRVYLPVIVVREILFMGPEAKLPTESIRNRRR